MHRPILLIGSGRLARHLRRWHNLLGLPYTLTSWSRRESLELLQEHLKTHSHVWLAISDAALIPFYELHLAQHHITVVHFSGALHDERLLCAHPLMTFSPELYDLSTYNSVYFSLTGVNELQAALPGFPNASGNLKPTDKALYHALCVVTGNIPQMLWSETIKHFRDLQIPDHAIEAYIKQAALNFISLKEDAITGPIKRQDTPTIQKNLSALERFPILKKIYSTFAEEFKL